MAEDLRLPRGGDPQFRDRVLQVTIHYDKGGKLPADIQFNPKKVLESVGMQIRRGKVDHLWVLGPDDSRGMMVRWSDAYNKPEFVCPWHYSRTYGDKNIATFSEVLILPKSLDLKPRVHRYAKQQGLVLVRYLCNSDHVRVQVRCGKCLSPVYIRDTCVELSDLYFDMHPRWQSWHQSKPSIEDGDRELACSGCDKSYAMPDDLEDYS